MLKSNLRQELCELIGVACLCFLAIGIGALGTDMNPIKSSIFAGSVVMLIIYGVGTISGAHINPAVTFGFFVSKRFPQGQFFRYVTAQILGSILALIALLLVIDKDFDWLAAAPKISSPIAFIVEACLTGSLVFIIFSVATGDCRICPDTRPIAGFVVGGAIATLAYFGSSLGVGVLNPVVPFIFAILAGTWLDLLKYILAMVIGSFIAVLLYQITRSEPNKIKEST